MGEDAEYFSKDFDWEELRIRVENDPLLQYHLLPFQPCDSIPSVSAEADSDAWSRFHLRHSSGKFFKERRYLLKEFPELVSCKKNCKVLEVGCGNGSTALPILRGNENIVIYACDCSTETLERAKEIINDVGIASLKDRFCPFYCDFSTSKFPTWLACNSCRGNTSLQQPSFTTPEKEGSQATESEESECCIGGVDFLCHWCVMAPKPGSADGRTRSSFQIFIVIGLCLFFYILGAWQRSGFGKGDSIAMEITKTGSDCNIVSNLNFENHHGGEVETIDESKSKTKMFESCDAEYTDYTPCQDQKRAMTFPRNDMIYRERHCPVEEEKLHCLIPAPKGYVTPFTWPKSRDYVPFANAPYKSLTVEKAVQNWIQYEGNVFRFPGGGTQFPQGADKYIDQLAAVVPIKDGTVRTALDTGCGVASWGAYLLSRHVLAMSFAPRDSHEAQVQFALERGVPAVIGVLGTVKLPYPSRAFDMAHCSRCLIPWGANDGKYLMEVDRVLRPGGYWVLSGPPINWKTNYKSWQRPREELEEEQRKIEEVAKLLCWEKKSEKGEIAIWQKRVNIDSCRDRQDDSQDIFCKSPVSDDVWYEKMETCITPYPNVESSDEAAGGELKTFPARLYAVPPRISSGSVPGISVQAYQEDNNKWKRHVKAYKKINSLLDTGRYRNIMDMNAGLGSFAAALESSKLWVMNVMPTIAEKNTLGVIYERGLIGIYHDWCEAFSTYPRTYDLIHAHGLFSLYQDKCNMEDILLEMDRILRPEGAVIFRDEVDVLIKVKKMIGGMRWDTKMVDHEDGPLVPEKVLIAVKQYWVVGGKNSTSH